MGTFANSTLRKKYSYLLGRQYQMLGTTKEVDYYRLLIMTRPGDGVYYDQIFSDIDKMPKEVVVETQNRIAKSAFRWVVYYTRYVPPDGAQSSRAEGRCAVSKATFLRQRDVWYRYRIAPSFRQSSTVSRILRTNLWDSVLPNPVNPVREYYELDNPRNRGKSTIRQSAPIRPNESKSRTYTMQQETQAGLGLPSEVPHVYYSRTWSGTRTPGYGSKKPAELPVNPHSVSLQFVNQGYAIWSERSKNPLDPNFNIITGAFKNVVSYGSYIPGWPTHDAEAQFKATSRLIQKASAGIDGNIAQDIAQWTQMQWLIGGNFNKISTALKRLRRGNLPGAISALFHGKNPRFHGVGPKYSYSIARNWLELQYGWKPLLMDIHGVMEATRLLMKKVQPLYAQTASATKTRSTSVKMFSPGYEPSISFGTREVYTSSRCRIGIRWQVDSQWTAFASQLGFTNPINLAWEIIPFSFVIDWALPIGPYLEALSSFQGLVFKDGFMTLFTRQDASLVADFQGNPTTIPTWLVERTEKGIYQETRIVLNRSKLTSFPRQRLPSLKNPLSVTHALNALALLRVVFARGR